MKTINVGNLTLLVCTLGESLPKSGPDAALIAHTLFNEYDLTVSTGGAKEFMQKTATLSATCDYPVICGLKTKTGNLRHVSIFTFTGGQLVDIADRTISLCHGYTNGDTIKVLRLKNADVGILVDTDILFAKNWRKTAPHCNIIISIAERNVESDFAFVPTLASLFAKPYIVTFANGDLMWGNPK